MSRSEIVERILKLNTNFRTNPNAPNVASILKEIVRLGKILKETT